MDAIEFLREKERMCDYFREKNQYNLSKCAGCNIHEKIRDGEITTCFTFARRQPNEIVKIVEEWAKEHPVKTRLSEFKKLFPNYNYPSDLPRACVRVFDCTATCRTNCHECKKKFWFTPIEEEEE